MAVLLGEVPIRLEQPPYWHRTFRFARLMLGAVICSSLSASSIFRTVEPNFLDHVITLDGEGEPLGKEDKIGNFPRPLETAESVSEALLGFLIVPTPGEEQILNRIGGTVFGPAACFTGVDSVPVCILAISPLAFLDFPRDVNRSSVLGGFAPAQPMKWVATFSGQASYPDWMITSFLKQASESGVANNFAGETLPSELGTLLVVLFGLGLMLIPLVLALFDKWRTERGRAKFWSLSNK